MGCAGKSRILITLKKIFVDLVLFSSTHPIDRKSTRLNSSHSQISYAVFCLKKKNTPYLTSVVAIVAPPPALPTRGPRTPTPHARRATLSTLNASGPRADASARLSQGGYADT